MDALADLNTLLALVDPRHADHDAAADWFAAQPPGFRLGVCRVTQMGLIRLLANATVMRGKPLPLREAWDVCDRLLQDPNLAYGAEPPRLVAVWRNLCASRGTAPGVVMDAYLAAFAISAGIPLVSFDRAMRSFDGLRVIIPAARTA